MTAGDGGAGRGKRTGWRATATVVPERTEAGPPGPAAEDARDVRSRASHADAHGGGRSRVRRSASAPGPAANGAAGNEESAPEPPPAPRPLVAPTPRVRLLAAVILAALIGTVGGGLAAWAVYLHLGPVQRPAPTVPGTKGGQAGDTVAQLASAAANSLVAIATRPVPAQSLAGGSTGFVNGVIVSTDGLVLTSAHAVAGATLLRVGLADGSSYNATIAATDTAHGLALLRLAGASGLTPLNLTSTPPVVGDPAYVVYNPPGVGLSVGVGTVTATNERITSDSTTGAALTGAATIDSTQEPGADGAPVLDSAGQLAGIVSTVSDAPSPPGITMLSVTAARALIAGASGGTAAVGTFGVESSYLDPAHAAAVGLAPGALIASVVAGGPGAAAGLRPGDVVTSVNGHPIDSATAFDPTGLGLSPGDTAALTVVRGTTTLTLTLTVGSAAGP